MPKPRTSKASTSVTAPHEKVPICQITSDRKREVVAQLTDDVLAKLTSAFFQVVSKERWGKRDLALISGLNETAIGHILAGRRKNLTVETIALLARAMQKRPELVLHDTRPTGNRAGLVSSSTAAALEQPSFQAINPSGSVSTIQGVSAALLQESPQQQSGKEVAKRFLEMSEQAGLIQRSG